jgi:hypothetical protein
VLYLKWEFRVASGVGGLVLSCVGSRPYCPRIGSEELHVPYGLVLSCVAAAIRPLLNNDSPDTLARLADDPQRVGNAVNGCEAGDQSPA